MQHSRRIAHPASVETHVDDGLLDFRQAPAVAIVEQETSFGTVGVLAEVALGSPGRFAPFDDLLALTVRAADCDERHGPFLPKGDYEDEAQCDINLSLSPLLKHYPPPVCPSTIPLINYYIKSFQQASSVERPWPGGERRRGGRAS